MASKKEEEGKELCRADCSTEKQKRRCQVFAHTVVTFWSIPYFHCPNRVLNNIPTIHVHPLDFLNMGLLY